MFSNPNHTVFRFGEGKVSCEIQPQWSIFASSRYPHPHYVRWKLRLCNQMWWRLVPHKELGTNPTGRFDSIQLASHNPFFFLTTIFHHRRLECGGCVEIPISGSRVNISQQQFKMGALLRVWKGLIVESELNFDEFELIECRFELPQAVYVARAVMQVTLCVCEVVAIVLLEVEVKLVRRSSF